MTYAHLLDRLNSAVDKHVPELFRAELKTEIAAIVESAAQEQGKTSRSLSFEESYARHVGP